MDSGYDRFLHESARLRSLRPFCTLNLALIWVGFDLDIGLAAKATRRKQGGLTNARETPRRSF